MRAAAGYRSSSSEEPGVPNLPGFRHAQHYMAMTQVHLLLLFSPGASATHVWSRASISCMCTCFDSQPRRSSLKYVCGYPIVEDKVRGSMPEEEQRLNETPESCAFNAFNLWNSDGQIGREKPAQMKLPFAITSILHPLEQL
eukprot:1159990-Pelagomonas_calceolata.AAC.6